MKIRIKIVKSTEKIPGGLGAKLTGSMEDQHQQIADEHGVSVEEIEAELEKGIEVEMEHTTDEDMAHEIAMDHLLEDPKYYTNLSKIEEKKKKKKKKKGKKDACYRKVRARYDVWPSAYASGALVKCRKVGAKNWGNSKKNEEIEIQEKWSEKYKRSIDCDSPKGFSQRAHCQGREKNEELIETIKKVGDKWVVYSKKGGKRLGTHSTEAGAKKQLAAIEISKQQNEQLDEKKRKLTHKPSSESSLHDWFGRKGAKGKKKGWVDCNSPDGKGGYKSCGREEGEKRKKYPSCRPTPASCKKHKGTKGKSWGKKSAKGKKG